MAMLPSFVAAGTYGVLKVAGYSAAGLVINRALATKFNPIKFGLIKTGLGFIGGLSLFLFYGLILNAETVSDLQLYLSAVPVRLFIWFMVIRFCMGKDHRLDLILALAVAGVAWSFALDYLMSGLYSALPGMTMFWC